MKRLLLGSLLVIAAALPAPAQDRVLNIVTVTGEGEVSIAPDLAMLTAGVTTNGKTAREASEANAKAMTAVMGALKALGIEERDIATTRLSLYPLRDNKGDGQRITGFQASNQVTVKIRDVAKIADVLDRLVAAGANDIGGVQFVVSAPSKPLDTAREAAIADARRKAELYAKAAGVMLGPAKMISEDGGIGPPPVILRQAREAAATPISAGEQTQRVSVTVSYELQR
jgi:uncharacterized protein YggE